MKHIQNVQEKDGESKMLVKLVSVCVSPAYSNL